MPMHRIPLVAVRRQWGQRTFSLGPVVLASDAGSASSPDVLLVLMMDSAIDAMASAALRRSWRAD